MAGSIPPGLKAVKTFLMRGMEVEKSNHQFADIISYCCRRYAVQKALPTVNMKEMPAVANYLMTVMDQLEKDKLELDEKYTSEEGSLSKEKQLKIVKDFALKVFKSSDDTYRNGKANKGTAKGFYAAAAYLEVADPDSEQSQKMRKVAKFKATEILTAIKEGRKPIPPDIKDDDSNEQLDGDPVDYDLGIDLPPAPAANNAGLDFGNAFNTTVIATPENMEEEEGPDEVIPSFDKLPINARMSARAVAFTRQASLINEASFGGQGNKQTFEAEGYTRKAVDDFKKNDSYGGIENICKALEILELRKPPMNVPDSGLSDAAKLDAIEYLLFAARTLECAGKMFSLQDAKKRAADLLSNALQTAQRG